MRCVAYCTTEYYQLNKIADLFKKQGYHHKFYRNVLYICNKERTKELFFFNIGCFVSWNLTSKEEREVIAAIKPYSSDQLVNMELDRFVFRYGIKTSITVYERFNLDLITLEDNDPQIKLAIAYGLAQSVKLNVYEESVKNTIQRNSSLPKQLASQGRISLNSREISKKVGEIFLERSAVNLSSEYLDMPEYFWQYPSLDDYYVMVEKYLDIRSRVNSLNQRLDVLHDLFNILDAQLQHRHSNILETIIIILIMLEVLMTIFLKH